MRLTAQELGVRAGDRAHLTSGNLFPSDSETVPNKSVLPIGVREASLNDYAQIAALESRYGLQTKPEDEWKHLWNNNPVYRLLAKSWPIGWVLQDPNRQIVGYIGNIPLSYALEGRDYLVATTRAWVVEPEYRGYSLLLLDYFFSQKNVDLYLTTSLNKLAFEGFQSFQPLPVPTGNWNESAFWITNYTGFLASSLRAKQLPASKFLTYPLSLAPFLRDQLRRVSQRTRTQQIDIQYCSNFDERFDGFWDELRRERPNVLLATRTREVLDWHFRYALLRDEVWILCAVENSRLLAFSIFYREDNIKFGLRRMRLGDFQALRGNEFLLFPMLSRALERCQREKIHMLEVLGASPQNAHILERLAPYKRKLSSWLSFYKTNLPQLGELLKDPNRWDLSCLDGDISL